MEKVSVAPWLITKTVYIFPQELRVTSDVLSLIKGASHTIVLRSGVLSLTSWLDRSKFSYGPMPHFIDNDELIVTTTDHFFVGSLAGLDGDEDTPLVTVTQWRSHRFKVVLGDGV